MTTGPGIPAPESGLELRPAIAELLDPLGFSEVSTPTRLGGGSSQENWAFTARAPSDRDGEPRSLLLRRDPASGVVDTSREQEFKLLAALAGTGLPVARVHALDDGTLCGRPAMVVDRLPGQAHRALLRDKDPFGLGLERRGALADELARLLGRVHRVDVSEAGLDQVLTPPKGSDPAQAELTRWTAELRAAALEPLPALEVVRDWLEEHVPPPVSQLRLVHGDFRPANVLVSDRGIETLLDWELARLGDPHDDLGWYTCSVYRAEHSVPGRFELDEFLGRWSEQAGLAVEPERLHFWQVMSTFRLAVIATRAVRNFCEGTTDRPAAPPARVVQLALAETGLVGAGQQIAAPMRPRPSEVVAGVRAVLRDTIEPELTSGHARSRLADIRAVLAQLDWDDGVLDLRRRTAELRAALVICRAQLEPAETADEPTPLPESYEDLQAEREQLAEAAVVAVRELRARMKVQPGDAAGRAALTALLAAL